jgi:hypothetical protein
MTHIMPVRRCHREIAKGEAPRTDCTSFESRVSVAGWREDATLPKAMGGVFVKRHSHLLGFVAFLFGVTSILALAGAAPAVAKSVKGVGQYSCDPSTQGQITFSPPWSDAGKGTVTATINAEAEFSCHGGSPTPIDVHIGGTLKLSNGFSSCNSSPGEAASGKLKLTYPAEGIKPSTISLPKEADEAAIASNPGMGPGLDINLVFTTVKGSYATSPNEGTQITIGSWEANGQTCLTGISELDYDTMGLNFI